MSATKTGTAVAVLVSTGVIVTCTVVVALLINDINALYDEVVLDLELVREVNRDAWDGMMELQQKKGPGDIRNLFEFRRKKRQDGYDNLPSQCSKLFL